MESYPAQNSGNTASGRQLKKPNRSIGMQREVRTGFSGNRINPADIRRHKLSQKALE